MRKTITKDARRRFVGVAALYALLLLAGAVYLASHNHPQPPDFGTYGYQTEQVGSAVTVDMERAYNASQSVIDAENARIEAERVAAEQAEAERIAAENQQQEQAFVYDSTGNTGYASGGGSRELRIGIESDGNYGAYDGAYAGAYQFAVEYLEGRMQAAGLEYLGVDDFLASPAKQDALADWYADSRYGGWENTPTVGGW